MCTRACGYKYFKAIKWIDRSFRHANPLMKFCFINNFHIEKKNNIKKMILIEFNKYFEKYFYS